MTAQTGKFVAYYRVSTDKQGERGLGMDAQRTAVAAFLAGTIPIAEFTEVESGKRADRPQLEAALAICKRQKAKLIIAKLDRLSRNVAFIAAIMDSGIEFVAVDNPHATKLTVHILAAVAQHEREMISQRTREAMQAAKARGTTLGNPRLDEARAIAIGRMRAESERHAAIVMPIIGEIQSGGIVSLRGIARALAARGIATARGGTWSAVQVADLLRRFDLRGGKSNESTEIKQSNGPG